MTACCFRIRNLLVPIRGQHRASSPMLLKIGDFDLVICGERATDGDTRPGRPGNRILLTWPLSTFTSEIISIDEGKIQVRRLVEGGYEELDSNFRRADRRKEISDPRLPTLRGSSGLKVWKFPYGATRYRRR